MFKNVYLTDVIIKDITDKIELGIKLIIGLITFSH